MRTIIAVLCVAIGMFLGASLRPAAQPQQEEWLPFRSGATVKLYRAAQSMIVCKVQQVTRASGTRSLQVDQPPSGEGDYAHQ